MKIVWVTRSDVRRMTNGANLYSRGLVNALRSCGVDVTVYGYDGSDFSDLASDDLPIKLFPLPRRNRALSLFTMLQSDAYRMRSADLAAAVSQGIDNETDAVVFDYFTMGWVLPTVRRRIVESCNRTPALVYVSHNHERTLRRLVAKEYSGNFLMKAVLRIDAWKAALLEQKLIDAVDLVTAITASDEALFRTDAPGKPTLSLLPAYEGTRDGEWVLSPKTARRVVMMGSLEWIAKRESLRRFAEAASEPFHAAGVELVVIGKVDRDFKESIRSKCPICTFLGFVEDPTAVLRNSRIGLMADELGGGFKLKYLDYIFRGLPVATIRSQAVGLPFSVDKGMLTADTASELVKRIVESIDDLDQLNRIKRVALTACVGKFDLISRGEALRDSIMQARRSL